MDEILFQLQVCIDNTQELLRHALRLATSTEESKVAYLLQRWVVTKQAERLAATTHGGAVTVECLQDQFKAIKRLTNEEKSKVWAQLARHYMEKVAEGVTV